MFGIKTKLLLYAKTHIPAFDGPRLIRIIPIGYACNHCCPMCWRMQLTTKEKVESLEKYRNELSIEDYARIFAHMPKSVKEIEVVGGGEPLLFPHIQSLFSLIKQRSIYGRLITNGSLLTKSIIQQCVRLRWDEIRISINAGTRSVYTIINGVDNFDRVITNIKDSQFIRGETSYPKIILNFVIQKNNVNDIGKFIHMSKRLNIDGIHFDVLIQFKRNKHLVLDEAERIKTINMLKKQIRTAPGIHNIKATIYQLTFQPNSNTHINKSEYFRHKYCDIVQFNMDIDANGETRPCDYVDDSIPRYNVKSMSIQNIWDKYRALRRRLYHGKFYPFCYSCTAVLPKR